MKSDLDPRIVTGIIVAVVVIAAAGIYFATRGPGDRSGPQVTAKYEGGRAMGGGGWKPGMTQGQIAHGGVPGSQAYSSSKQGGQQTPQAGG